jgi:hypothetical protein
MNNPRTKYIGLIMMIILAAGAFSLAQAEPLNVSIQINGIKPYPGDPISATPKIEVTLTSSSAVQSADINVGPTRSNLNFVQTDIYRYLATHEVTTPLTDGVHGITIEVTNVSNEAITFEAIPLYVQSAANVIIQGFALNYPNPFDPGTQSTRIGYTLSKPANVKLNIFDLSGNLVRTTSFTAGQEGGRAGYNEVPWDGKYDGGNYVGNGIYPFLIVANGKVVPNGIGKITVFKQ